MSVISNVSRINNTNLKEVKRTALEASLSVAIKRAQTKYLTSDRIEKASSSPGPEHLGRKIDIKV